jgi:hypothetical protein
MNRAHTFQTPQDIDLHTTRRRFQLAREQVAANTRTEHFLAARAMRHWARVADEDGAKRR